MPDLNAVLRDLPDAIFRRCVEDSSDAIMLTDTTGKICYINKSWTRLYGYLGSEALGQSPGMLHSGLHERAFYQGMWADILSESKGFWSGEVTNRAKDGSLKTVLLTITPYRQPDSSGDVMGFMGLAVDLSMQKEMQRRLEQQDKLSMIGTLASAIAHELGTPLGVIRGRAELLVNHFAARSESKEPEQDVLHRSAAAILGQVDRVTVIMDRILSFVRHPHHVADPGSQLVEPRRTVQQIFEDIEGLVSSHFRKSGVRLEVAMTHRDCSSTSGSAIEQILVNLLLNAVNAILSAGARERFVRLEVMEPRGKKSVFGQHEGAKAGWVFVVEDTGPGVSDALRRKIFEPFFTTNSPKGTGLGLAISSQIAQTLGGELVLAQSGGLAGARFELRLPDKTIQRP